MPAPAKRRRTVATTITVLGIGLGAWMGSAAVSLWPAIASIRRGTEVARAPGPLAAQLDEFAEVYLELGIVTRDPRMARLPGVKGALERRVDAAYAEMLYRELAAPAHRRIEAQLRAGGSFDEQRARLALYLLFQSSPERWEASKKLMEARWGEARWEEARDMSQHVSSLEKPLADYVALVRRGKAAPPEVDAALVAEVRRALTRASRAEQLEQATFLAVRDARCNPAKPPDVGNLDFPPTLLANVRVTEGSGRSSWTPYGAGGHYFASRREARGEPAAVVDGAYTQAGHAAVLHRMQQEREEIPRTAWAVTPGADEQPEALDASLRALYAAQAARSAEQWAAWVDDLVVVPPKSPAEARDLYVAIETSRYLSPVTALAYAGTWPNHDPPDGACGPIRCLGLPDDAWMRRAREAPAMWQRLTGQEHPPAYEVSQSVRAELSTWRRDARLTAWMTEITGLRGLFDEDPATASHLDRRAFAAQRERARAAADRFLATLDERAQRFWRPLLLEPLAFEPGR